MAILEGRVDMRRHSDHMKLHCSSLTVNELEILMERDVYWLMGKVSCSSIIYVYMLCTSFFEF